MIKKIMLYLLIFLLVVIGFFFLGTPPQAEKITWGVNFSQKHAQNLGLNWKETYLALLADLEVKNIKLITHWDLIEPVENEYFFEDLDWQVEKVEEKGAKILLVIGMKTGRWPECHIPEWAKNLTEEKQQEEILELLEAIILRYRGRPSVNFWQVENEPFFPFGECPKIEKNFLKKEIDLVKSLDKGKPVIISDSGEFSFWIGSAKLGDIVGTTLHRKAWFKEIKSYISYPFRPIYYWRKAQIIEKFFNKKVICVELQLEPWGETLLYWLPLEEQEKTMNLGQFRKNIEFAKETGLDTFYLWGAEWWYWLKEKNNQPGIWNEAKKLF
jgi:hypothetical protein